jgi:folate-binding protein YgfZ
MTSPFANKEREAGATFVERFGVDLPEHYGDPDLEYRAACLAGGLVDLSFRGMLQLTGGERLRWLSGQITNDAQRLKAGEGMLAAVLNVKGHLLSDLAVYGLDESVWLDLPRDRAEVVREAFDRRIVADDVQVETLSDRFAHLMLVGPRASSIMAGAGVAAPDLPPWHHAEVHLGVVPLRIVSSRWLALPCLDVIVPGEAAGKTWDTLLACGREAGMRPVGLTALEWLRVEAGWAWFGVDYDESNLLMESLTPGHVSFNKGCYVGQEVVTRIEHQGHLNKKLCGLTLDGMTIPVRGAPIALGDRKVGQVTSAVRSPTLGRVVALGYLRRECWAPGTRLHIGTAEASVEASVAPLPFVGEDAFGRAGGRA